MAKISIWQGYAVKCTNQLNNRPTEDQKTLIGCVARYFGVSVKGVLSKIETKQAADEFLKEYEWVVEKIKEISREVEVW